MILWPKMKFSLRKALHALLATFGIREDRRIDGILRTLHAPDGRHRLFVFHRANGKFGFQEELYDDRPLEPLWRPVLETEGEDYDTPEEALAAARAGIDWLAWLQD